MAAEGVSGSLLAVDSEAIGGVAGEIRVPMAGFSTGDRLQDWKLGAVLDASTHPLATFSFKGLVPGESLSEGRIQVNGVGSLAYRGQSAEVSFEGAVGFDETEAWADIECILDVRSFGVIPPSLLGFSVSPEVRVVVRIRAAIAG
jgi:hypothetical protein